GAETTWTMHQDNDGDGWGTTATSQLGCTAPTGFVWRGGEIDDCCFCDSNETNDTDTNNQVCYDDFGNCVSSVSVSGCTSTIYSGDGYESNCKDLNYLLQYYNTTGTCVNMDCTGAKTSASGGSGTATVRYYNLDSDGDGWGTQAAGYHCSADANTIEDTGTDVTSGLNYYVIQTPDIDEDCYCQANTYADCFDCAGNCRYNLDGTDNVDYIGTSKTDTGCVVGNLSGSPGCECGVCDGAKTTWYQDNDGDGWGTDIF
ncbi:uncharacterized protein METZ01_LOCUS446654, partial [marine metagenome]